MAQALYPVIDIPRIKNPNRFYAFPIIGGLAKIVMLIPVFIWFFLVGFAAWFMSIFINSFVVLFTGKYWKPSYEINVLLIHLVAKTAYFFNGLTNTYPGFSGELKEFTMDIPYPQHPNRFFAVPIIGGLARGIITIPYFCYIYILQNGAGLAAVVASFPVLFSGKYPEACYELVRDFTRLVLASSLYGYGLEDRYPSFWISMNHKVAKIVLIVVGILFLILNHLGGGNKQNTYQQQYQQYQVSPLPTQTTNTGYNY